MATATPLRDAQLRALATSSLELILTLQDSSGAYPASPSFSAYVGYSWFRDGAFIADAVSAAGAWASAQRFFDWGASVIVARTDEIEHIVDAAAAGDPVPDERMLATRFTFDGAEGSDEWWDFQLDGYGTWLWALAEHCRRSGTAPSRWARAIDLCVRYLASSWARPCFDWWEEHSEQVHVSTLGCIAAGLRAALALDVLPPHTAALASAELGRVEDVIAHDAVTDGHLSKWLGSAAVDASLAALVGALGVVDAASDVGRSTIAALEDDLVRGGGTWRYVGDTFFGGGQWPLLSCMLGQAHLAAGDRDRARKLLEWAASTADAEGMLPEQVTAHLLDPSFEQEWIERWGPSARPLLWSHAMVLRLTLDLGVVAPADLAGAHG